MKNTAKLLAIVMVLSLIVTVFTIAPAALDSGDWEVVCAPTGTPNNPQVETTANNGIRLSHEGHYPSSNAGLLYTQPLNIKDGISLNVTIETNNSNSSDVWYGICLMNKPVYFDTTNKDPESGFGIVLLCRPGDQFQWFTVGESGFTQATIGSGLDDKEYYADEGVTVDFEIKLEDGELNIYIDGVNQDYDFAEDLLPYLEDNQAYICFSMSQTELEYQSFVINYLNGKQPASEGEAITKEEGETEAETEEENTGDGKSFVLADFTDPESDIIKTMSKTCHNCKLSYDEVEGALKVEITGEDPFFNIPMKKKTYFDGDEFCMVKVEYKTDCEGTGEFYFTTKEVPSMEYCNVQYEVEATGGEFKTIELDMQEESMNWSGQIRNFRVDPLVDVEEGAEQVFYYKSISFEVWEQETTEAPVTEEATAAETDNEGETAGEGETAEATEAESGAVTDEEGKTVTDAATGTQKEAETTKPENTDNNGGVPFWVWIIAGVVGVAAIAAVVVIVIKKKKA